jgi:hypothetical protein
MWVSTMGRLPAGALRSAFAIAAASATSSALALSSSSPPQAASIEAMPSIAKAVAQYFIPLVTVTLMDVSCSFDHRSRGTDLCPRCTAGMGGKANLPKLRTWPYRTFP